MQFATSTEGGLKNVSTATQEATDLSKFLYVVNSTKRDLRQVSHMTNVVAYLNKLRESKDGPSGQAKNVFLYFLWFTGDVVHIYKI